MNEMERLGVLESSMKEATERLNNIQRPSPVEADASQRTGVLESSMKELIGRVNNIQRHSQ